MSDYPKFTDLLGRTLTRVENIDNERIRFTADDGAVFDLYHSQDCCESVRVEDIAGNLDDLVESPITMADESSSSDVPDDVKAKEPDRYVESETWTFYRLATVKGYVTIRWLGESNGYYSEAVDFAQISGPDAPAPSTSSEPHAAGER